MNNIKIILTSVLFSFLLIFNLGVNTANATGIYDLPVINAGEDIWVYDDADAISKATESQLSNELKNLAQKTGFETRFVIINRLDYDTTIDSLSQEILNTWYPTPEERANQTILLLDTLTNRSAIASGENVTTLLTPSISESLVKETMVASLKNLQYNQALIDSSDRIVAVLSGQEDPGAPEIKEANIEGTFATAEETDDKSATIWMIVLLGLATLIPMVTYFWYVGFPGN